jgi:serine phosphatase RsbU (regulator of sigma subunit)
MDIAVCAFDTGWKNVEFAGANNPLWIMRSTGAVDEVKGDKQPIGQFEGDNVPFTNHSISLDKGDKIYIFTDGYADQFGGEKGKKFKYKNLQNLLASIKDKPMPGQEAILTERLNEWKGNLEQVDDILVIGISI